MAGVIFVIALQLLAIVLTTLENSKNINKVKELEAQIRNLLASGNNMRLVLSEVEETHKQRAVKLDEAIKLLEEMK